MRFKLLPFFLILVVFVLVGAGCTQKPEPQGIILFVGDGCPHCANVEDLISKNNVKDKIPFVTLEVYHNQDNANLMAKKAQLCGIPLDSMGVPFLWDGAKCFSGDKDIIDFFQEKIK